MVGYRSRHVSKMLSLPRVEVRRLADSAFVSPRRGSRNELLFSFEDLVLLRTAVGLIRARIPRSRVCRALGSLREQLPDGRSLSAIRVVAEGGQVVAQDGGLRWHPETGQALLDFEATPAMARIVKAAVRRSGGEPPVAGSTWYRWGSDLAVRRPGGEPPVAGTLYRWGCDLEEDFPAKAEGAYRSALALEPEHPGAHLNLGRLLRRRGDPRGAEYHFRMALASKSHRSLAALHLGITLEEQGLLDGALLGYARALEADPSLADAHLRASRILEMIGRREDALHHLAEYRRLTR